MCCEEIFLLNPTGKNHHGISFQSGTTKNVLSINLRLLDFCLFTILDIREVHFVKTLFDIFTDKFSSINNNEIWTNPVYS